MSEHYDALETRDPAQREKDQFSTLAQTLARALQAPGWAKHLAGIDPKSVTSRAALAKLPVLKKSDLVGLQKETPPFGGYNVDGAGQGETHPDVAGADFRARRPRQGFRRLSRARCSRPAFAPATSSIIAFPII